MVRKVRGIALFDFDPSPEYPEQIRVVRNETFTILEICDDGWTVIKTANGAQGVIPSTYFNKIPLSTMDKIHDFSAMVFAKIYGFLESLLRGILELILSAFETIYSFLMNRVFTPIVMNILERVQQNQTAQSMLSKVSRNFYVYSYEYFMHDLSKKQLARAISEVEEYIALSKQQERSRIPVGRSSFVDESELNHLDATLDNHKKHK